MTVTELFPQKSPPPPPSPQELLNAIESTIKSYMAEHGYEYSSRSDMFANFPNAESKIGLVSLRLNVAVTHKDKVND